MPEVDPQFEKEEDKNNLWNVEVAAGDKSGLLYPNPNKSFRSTKMTIMIYYCLQEQGYVQRQEQGHEQGQDGSAHEQIRG